jgi:hypothetical protein
MKFAKPRIIWSRFWPADFVCLKFLATYENGWPPLIYGNRRCTVVRNPGGSLVFLANSFEGGTWGCEKIRGGGSCFIAFLCGSFSKIFIGGTWGAPLPPLPPPGPPPVCIYDGKIICPERNETPKSNWWQLQWKYLRVITLVHNYVRS